ncbi:N-acetylglucosamine-6-phosphate deacetylase [Roseivivax jejudonensis]|uniref:N-acetylglucosamine-6-phosphate deacetylase n=1 Tax=Roseivivax jejudonensis TaxID=1529041 RepID=A0A1X6Y3M1_9RHOB|nr:N-acetylglucosamine-6-phosphate deacetylase [Roseivivax jejudonensis]SLN09645.1 N-acetylglucosamine-6-phosphate deacetylase [Roseivivax jejudonensis]
MSAEVLIGARIFDGVRFRDAAALLIEDGEVAAIASDSELPARVPRRTLSGGILAPGLVDLQVNGGGGIQFNAAPTAETLSRMAKAHARLGTTTLLPTLITDRPEITAAAIAAAEVAVASCRGIGGLHLEGPHLDPARAGAHDRDLIRPMNDADLARLVDAAVRLPSLIVTLAPRSAKDAQIAALREAGAIVSIGHSDASHEAACGAIAAGVTMATHLFNAMSPLGHRAPGVVGAALTERLWSGIIADGIHVHPSALRIALAASPDRLFLVTDAMAPAGTDLDRFTLNGREVRRQDSRLTLEDGTLAGADLDLPRAMRLLMELGEPLETVLAMATSRPADAIGRADIGRLTEGGPADLVHLDDALRPTAIWQRGQPV